MTVWKYIEAEPSGFVMVKEDGTVHLKASQEKTAAGVGGDEWEAGDILNILDGETASVPGLKWQISRIGDEIIFEMIDPESKVDWGVPLKMTISRQALQEVVSMLYL